MRSNDDDSSHTKEPIYSKKTDYMLIKINESEKQDDNIRLKNQQTIQNICKANDSIDFYESLVEKT